MPRRGRARSEYDEESMYEVERDVHPRRRRDERLFEEDIRHKRRGPDMTPLEKLERMHLQAQRGPEIAREAHDYPRELTPAPMPPRREPEDFDLPPRERLRALGRDDASSRRGRPRPRELDMEEEIVFREESDREYTDSESDGDMVVVPRKERLLRRRELDLPDEPKPRSKSLLEDSRLREMEFERDELSRKEELNGPHRRHRSGPFYARSSHSRHRHRFHRHKNLEDADDELDEEVDKKILFREARKRRPGRSVEEEDIIFESRERSSSPEMTVPRAPSPVDMPPVREKHMREILPPRAPSPDIEFMEPEPRHRERGRKSKSEEEIFIVRREEKEVPPPAPVPARRLSPEPYRRERPIPTEPPKPRSLEREKDMLTLVRRDGSRESLEEEEIIQEDSYGPPGRRPLLRKDVKAMEEMDIARGPPRPKPLARTEIVTQEIKPPRYADRESKLVINDVRESDDEPDRQPGKIGRRYVGIKDRRENLWTEITKDLVGDVDALIERSEEIRRARRRRILEIHRERESMPPAPSRPPPLMPLPAAEKAPPLLLDHHPPPPPPRFFRDERRKKERDLAVEGGRRRPPPRSEWW
ncbi:hypothetical protein BO70DRAFT_283431 [Aspergillus heteromorphus CBS 117.55]|uniref:Uncharacterized protein n=1 Tax=Aspergillus heteromorphus CBS 117.55 TaxID=1448321 RepID=A0A317WWX1_9EURO|nr:uncharacterized protein BO70DRAFT_283431 [Aspergillus heteromorphus CBS 117.55]PWY90843.1 hypothetical protein BO70DRAFT_283431 [Aspergillus heteromorphus CBS 117.55]